MDLTTSRCRGRDRWSATGPSDCQLGGADSQPLAQSTREGLTRSVRPSSLLPSQAVQIPPELRGSCFRAIGQAARACFRPKRALPDAPAFCIPLIHPLALCFLEASLELGPSRLAALGDQLLVGLIEIRVVLCDRAVETGALIDDQAPVSVTHTRSNSQAAHKPLCAPISRGQQFCVLF